MSPLAPVLALLLVSPQDVPSRPITELVEQLRSDRVELREAAARELQRHGRGALPALEKAATDPDAEVAGRARKVIRAIGIGERLTANFRAKKPDALGRLVNGEDSEWTAILSEALGERPGPDLPNGLRRRDVEPLIEPALRHAKPDPDFTLRGGGKLLGLVNALSEHGLRSAAPELVRMLGSAKNYGLFSVINAALVGFDAVESIPSISDLLRHPDDQVRRNAAELLGRLGEASAVPVLRAALRDPEERVRKEAVIALGALRDPEILPELRACLKDPDFLTRAGALERMALRPDPAEAAHVVPLLEGKDAFIRTRAARVLSRIGARSAVPALVARLGDEDHRVRGAAAEALGRLGDRACVPRLLESLKDELLAAPAAQALGRLGDERAIPGLVALLAKPPNQGAVRAAAEALVDLGAKEGVPELLKIALEGDLGAAWLGLDALAARRAREAVPRLLEVVRSKDEPTRRAQAVHLLGRLRARDAAPALRELIREPGLDGAAIEALGRIGADVPVAPLVAALKDPQAGIRHRAGWTLVEANGRESIPELLKLLSDSEGAVREAAARTLGELRAGEAREKLRELLGDPSRTVQAAAGYARAALGDREVVPALIALLSADDWDAAWYASRGLVLLGAEEGIPALASLLEHDEAAFREFGVDALGGLGAGAERSRIRNLLRDPAPGVRAAAIRALGALGAVDALPAVRKRLGSEAETERLIPPSFEQRAAAAFLAGAGSAEGVEVLSDSFPSLLSLNALRNREAFRGWERARRAEPRWGTTEELLRALAKEAGARIELPADPAWLSERRRIEAGRSAAEALGTLLEESHGAIVEAEVVRILPRPAIRAFWREWLKERK